ncbi:hypothetical protein MKW92_053755 [Papaver armeniacum]|nr:hypothetical protein MKW92_053755 [Papaver armeniacum]
MMKTKVLHILVASLKRLFITNSKKYSCKLKIHSPNLQSLTYSCIPEDYDEMNHGFHTYLVQTLTLPLNFYWKRQKEKKQGNSLYFEEITPSFRNLRRLEVSSKCKRAGAWALFDLLPFLPNLESLVITPGFHPYPEHRDFQDTMAPECVLMKLKAVEFRNLFCQQVELNIIKFFLANSLVLETMTLVFCPTSRQGRKERFMKTIQMFPKASTRSVINFLA